MGDLADYIINTQTSQPDPLMGIGESREKAKREQKGLCPGRRPFDVALNSGTALSSGGIPVREICNECGEAVLYRPIA